VTSVSRSIDRVAVTFDDPTLVADAGLIVPATLMVRLGLEALVNKRVRLIDRVGGAHPGRKVLTLVASILAGGSHIDHADRLRAGATQAVLPFRVMAPSTLGTFLRSFTFGHIRQLDAVIAETTRRAWALGAGPGEGPMTIDMDSTICEVHGKAKGGAAYGYTRVLGYHPVLATRAGTGEVLHARLRKGSSQRGHRRKCWHHRPPSATLRTSNHARFERWTAAFQRVSIPDRRARRRVRRRNCTGASCSTLATPLFTPSSM
jgi:hypothetical protein